MMDASPEYLSVRDCFVIVSGVPTTAMVETRPSRSDIPSEVVHHLGLAAGKQSDKRVIWGLITATEYARPILDV